MNGSAAPTPAPDPHLPLAHALLALAVVAVWGTNFVVIKVALNALPPLTFATLRYIFALLPAVFFVPRPEVPWRSLATYGVAIGFGQFGLLFIAMDGLISPGLASLVVQMQIFFTIGLSVWLSGERMRRFQLGGLALATAGLVVILFHTDAATTPLGLALVLAAALSWGIGNHVAKVSGASNMLAFVVWASLFSIPPLLIATLVADGPAKIATSVAAASWPTWAAVLWQSVGNTLFGYSAWGWLLSRHPASTVSPLSMLVPVFGMSASALLLGEPLQDWKLLAGALVMSGLALNLLWPRLSRSRGH
ncbi:EamA family transporter [Sphingomonas sp. ID1715]|uniref:EamA family transporter n=1 Tax=Sphingomonas sp. ID1715 TaxID=1656898 RepID=UPI0014889454|nr:EamA family transporter [Sphingomonas sp. ID1715]NNM77956.1 EamA family transporter [Sphingomonas sp. ID1715]